MKLQTQILSSSVPLYDAVLVAEVARCMDGDMDNHPHGWILN